MNQFQQQSLIQRIRQRLKLSLNRLVLLNQQVCLSQFLNLRRFKHQSQSKRLSQ